MDIGTEKTIEILMTIEQKQKHLKESLKILKDHCLSREYCEGCEIKEICYMLYNQRVEDWKLEID